MLFESYPYQRDSRGSFILGLHPIAANNQQYPTAQGEEEYKVRAESQEVKSHHPLIVSRGFLGLRFLRIAP